MLAGIFCKPLGRATSLKLSQPQKTAPPSSIPFGRLTFSRASHPINAPYMILERVCGSRIPFKETHPLNASSPMVASPSEKWMRRRFLQEANASLPISFTEDGSVSSSSSLSPLKFSLPTDSTPFSITMWRKGAFDLKGTRLPLRRLPDMDRMPSSVMVYVITDPSFHVLCPLLTIFDISIVQFTFSSLARNIFSDFRGSLEGSAPIEGYPQMQMSRSRHNRSNACSE